MHTSPPSRRERGLVSPRYSSLGRGIVERVPERGLRVQPANLRGVVGREDRRATVFVAYASPGGTRLGLFPMIGWADQGTAPPAPSRHGMVPLSLWTTVIPWGERRVELARRHRSVARREPSAVTREVHHNRFTSRSRHDRVTRRLYRYWGNARIWRAVSRVVVGAIRSPAMPIGPGTQWVRSSSSTESPPSSCSEIRKTFPSSVR